MNRPDKPDSKLRTAGLALLLIALLLLAIAGFVMTGWPAFR